MTSLPADRARPAPVAPLVARTVPLDDGLARDLLALLPAAGATDACSWVRRGEGLVGWGRAAAHIASGPERFAELEQWWGDLVGSAVVRDEVDLPGTGPVAFGSVAYAAGSPAGGTLVVPEVVVGRRGGRAWLTTVSAVSAEQPVAAVPGPADVRRQDDPAAPSEVAFADGALTPGAWTIAVAEAVARITGGGLDKVVLARDLEVSSGAPLDVRWLLRRLAERYDTTWVFAVDGLVGATPELLVRREKGLVTSRVLAGTIRPTGDDAHDLALAASLARSSKDLEEHEYAVRSVADALAPHCTSMNVPETPFVLHLSNVMHLATDVAGVLADATSSLALAAALHPSAAVCGTPREAADAVIAELEHMDRGRYAGPVGWIDAAGDGEWGIALRCGAVEPSDPSRMRIFAGCGIVAGSDPDDELAESSAKLVPMRDALTAAAS
ncbi:isochorismate synthase [Phycicoccus duodecadis]|uniref:isochorismate synthase n=1 Tax=Phycicoccus duodecadis TaxID=173053 RepID=A0A2N3YHW4_9MICO|nr:isochorismate synthase [Phycicoccus duodecadis]PKW26421.1 isochorismate synthase [Phycicoccus duodecadis]